MKKNNTSIIISFECSLKTRNVKNIKKLKNIYAYANQTNKCKNQESTQIHKVINFQDILNKTQEAQVRYKDQYSELQNLRNKFEECKNRIENKIEQNYNHFFDLEQNLKQLQHSSDQQAFTQLLQNPSFQYLIQDEKKSESQNSFRQKRQYEFQQITEEMNTFIDNYQNYYDDTPQTQNSKQNNISQGSNLNQGNQSKKSVIKIQKGEKKTTVVCENQNNYQFDGQLQFQTVSEQEKISPMNQIELEKEKKQNQSHNNLQLGVELQKAQRLPQSKSKQDDKQIEQTQQMAISPQDSNRKEKAIMNTHLFRQSKIVIVNKDLQIVSTEKQVKLCKNLEKEENHHQIQSFPLDPHFVDIQLIDFQQILIHFTNKLQFYNLSLVKVDEKLIHLNKNKFVYKDRILYYYNDQTQQLIKEKLDQGDQPLQIPIKLEYNNIVIAMKIVGEQLHVGFSNGRVDLYILSNLEFNNRYFIKKQEQQKKFRKIYFEQDYCIGIQEKAVSRKVYNPLNGHDNYIHTKNTIIECSYLINHQNKQIEIQCLQEGGKVHIFKQNVDIICRNDELSYTLVSSIQACPKSRRFYYGYTNGDLKCVKQKY